MTDWIRDGADSFVKMIFDAVSGKEKEDCIY